jgi:hypothetical protein
MEFIDNPQFGHKKNKLPTFLVPVVMFAVLILGIIASKIYVDAVLHPSDSTEVTK